MSSNDLSVSIVIATHTLDRWALLVEAVTAALAQTHAPIEVIVAVDHKPELAEAVRARFISDPVRVVDSRYPGRSGSTKNAGLEAATADVVVVVDDDVSAPIDLVERLVEIYTTTASTQAVGVNAMPRFESERPRWLPLEFDWAFGCSYRGLPTQRGPMGRMIGSCMSARRDALLSVKGFHADHHDDLDISHRLIDRYGYASVLFEPGIEVMHFVPDERVKFPYFARRIYETNRDKVRVMRDLEDGGNHRSDVAFVSKFLFRYLPGYLASPQAGGWRQAGAGLAAIFLAASGNVVGRVNLALGRTEPAVTRGLEPPVVAGSQTPES
jgi:glycosyltransferase involved in cell wall biosynthesis